ncbi:MAG TPA: PAS domain-containing protein, partial [Rubricoccaceae bacterium]
MDATRPAPAAPPSSLVWEAFDRAPAFIAVLRGPAHVFEYTNQAYLQLVGFRDLLGRPAREALPEVEGQGFFELLDRVRATGEPFVGAEVAITLQREPGGPPEERYVDFVYQPLIGPGGSVDGILAQGIDATDRVRAHRELVAAHRDHDLVMAHSRDVLCLADAQGRFTRVSAAS